MGEELSVVGKRLPRWQAHAMVTGAAKYTVDIKLPGMLIGRIRTSPYPHAKILRIDKSKAEKLPGVEAVITFEDVPPKKFNPSKSELFLVDPRNELRDMYVLSDKARYIGDKIAAVAAISSDVAEEALELIDIEYEVLPAVFDPVEATKPGMPQIHDFAENNISLHLPFPRPGGDVERGFEEADVVVEETFQTSKQHLSQLEPCTCVASFDTSGRLTIWSPSQHPFLHRRKLAELFDMPEGMVRWITPFVGGGWGKYGSFGAEPICVALAKKTGKPVKLEYTREEDFFGTETREAYVETGKIGVKKDGTITALQEKIVVHGGAYFTHNSSTTTVNMTSFTSLYRCPNVTAEADCVYTNVPPSGGCRGYGNPAAMWALEQLVDMAASDIGMDPIELRLKNLKKAGDPGVTGLPMETCTLEECIKLGAERIGWGEKRRRKKQGARRFGIGMAIMMHVSGAQPQIIQHRNVYIKFNADGSANLIVGACDIGQNILGTISQIAAEVLGVRYEDIHVLSADTDSAMFHQGMHASGGLYQIGNAVIRAATEAKKQLMERAAKKLGVSASELGIEDRQVYIKTAPEKRVSIAEVIKEAIYNFEGEHLNISAKGSFSPTLNPPPFEAVFAEVEVDVETGEVKILKLLIVNDVGRAINPTTVEGQLEGGVAQGIGYTLTEDYFINKENGVLESDNFTTYKILSPLDMPEVEVILLEKSVPSGPFGAKGVGEAAMVAVAPAIGNAIYDAIGVRVKDMPVTPEKILEALKAKSGAN